MGSEGVETDVGQAAVPLEDLLMRYAPAYAFFMVAAWAVVALWCFVMVGDVADALRNIFWVAAASGPAAALGAAAVHRPFMRAVRGGRAPRAHGWAALAVVVAHLAYAALVFIWLMVADPQVRNAWLAQRQYSAALTQAGEVAGAIGAVSLIFGLLPNLLIAQGFAAFMLRARGRGVPASEVQSSLEGARNESAAFAE